MTEAVLSVFSFAPADENASTRLIRDVPSVVTPPSNNRIAMLIRRLHTVSWSSDRLPGKAARPEIHPSSNPFVRRRAAPTIFLFLQFPSIDDDESASRGRSALSILASEPSLRRSNPLHRPGSGHIHQFL